MIKKLRNKLLMVNMITLSMIMLAAFGTIYIVIYSNTMRENNQKLEQMPVLSFKDTEGPIKNPPNIGGESNAKGIKVQGYNALPLDFYSSFSVCINNNGKIIGIISHLDMSEKDYEEAVDASWNTGNQKGEITIEGRKWQYGIIKPDLRHVLANEKGAYRGSAVRHGYVGGLTM